VLHIINLLSECPTVHCMNAGTLDKSTCICQCKEQFTGWMCSGD